MKIPKQLQHDVFRFVLLNGKKPIENDWPRTANYKFDDQKLLQHIAKGGNYGVCGGFGNLLIVDFDNEEIQEKILPQMPPGFAVKTGRGLLHKYFICPNAESVKMHDDTRSTLADVQGPGRQCVGPGSIHPDTQRQYVVVDDGEIPSIDFGEIKALFAEWIIDNPKRENKARGVDDPIIQDIKKRINLIDVLKHYGVDVTKHPTSCIWHSSKGGHCFSYNQEVFNCFHQPNCGRSGNMFHFVMFQENCDFPTAKRKLAELAGVKIEMPRVNGEKEKDGDLYADEDAIEKLRQVLLSMFADDDSNYNEAIENCTVFILDRATFKTVRADKDPEMWFYKEGIFIRFGRTYIKEFCKTVLGPFYTSRFANQVCERVAVQTFVDEGAFFNQKYPFEIPVQNGILNIDKRTLSPFTPAKVFFNKLPMRFDPKATCPEFKKFLFAIVKDGDIVVLQELLGFVLLHDYRFPKGFIFIGVGRNGKSTFIEALKRFVGPEQCSAIPLQGLSDDHFALCELFAKLVNIAADISPTALSNTTMFKAVTGGDYVRGDRKHLPSIHFVNSAKMVFSCNELPATSDTTPAFFARWVMVDFPFCFYSKEELARMAALGENVSLYKEADRSILDRITTADELGGVLNFALEGFQRLMSQGGFSNSETANEIRLKWTRKSDSFSSFIDECLVVDPSMKITKKDMRQAYKDYCENHKLKLGKDTSIKRGLRTIGVEDGETTIAGEFVRYWDGIRFVEKLQGLQELHGFSPYRQNTQTSIELEKGATPATPAMKQYILHKCHKCGFIPSAFFDKENQNQPICEMCFDDREKTRKQKQETKR